MTRIKQTLLNGELTLLVEPDVKSMGWSACVYTDGWRAYEVVDDLERDLAEFVLSAQQKYLSDSMR